MILFLLGFILQAYSLQCPEVFFVASINSLANIFSYSLDYNYITLGSPNLIHIIQVDSGTYKEQLQSNMPITVMTISDSWLLAGGNKMIVIYSLNQMNHIVNQLPIPDGQITYIQVINQLISAGTDQSYGLLWDPNTNQIVGRLFSNNIIIAQVFYQIVNNNKYDTIYIGTSGSGSSTITYLQYFTQTFTVLSAQQQISNSNIYQIYTTTSGNIITSYVYQGVASNLQIIQIVNNAGTVTITVQTPISIGFGITSLLISDKIIQIFGSGCQYSTYNIDTAAITTAITWQSPCPNVGQIYYNSEIKLLIALLSTSVSANELVSIYQFSGTAAATQIRSLYYVDDTLTTQTILSNQYVIQGGQSGNLYIFNQWFQMAAFITGVGSNPIQIVDEEILVVVYQSGLIQQWVSNTITCQFTGYSCYQYQLGASQSLTYTGTITNQYLEQLSYQSITYLLHSVNNEVYVLNYQSNAFSSILYTYTMGSNVITINAISSIQKILIQLSNNQLVIYDYGPFVTSSTATPTSYTIQGNQITFNSNYLFSTDGSNIYIYSLNTFNLVQTVNQIGFSYKQLLAYGSDQMMILEKNAQFIGVCTVSSLVAGQYAPYDMVVLTFPATSIAMNGNNLLVINNSFGMLVKAGSYYNGISQTSCQFSQNFGGSQNFLYVNIQNSFRQIQLLYQTIYSLKTIQATIYIQSTVAWNQIVVNQIVNTNVALTIQQDSSSTTTPDLVLIGTIQQFQSLTLQNINIISANCQVEISTITTVSLTQLTFQQKSSTLQCPYIILSGITTFTQTSLTLTNIQLTKPLFSLSQITTFTLNQLTISNCQVKQLVQLTSPSTINLQSVQLSSLSCVTGVQLDSLIQYTSLTINTFTIQNSNLCSLVFSNYIAEGILSVININTVNVLNNQFTDIQNTFFLQCITASNDIALTAQVTATNIQSSGNTLSTTGTDKQFWIILLYRGQSVSITNSQIKDSGFQQWAYQTVSYSQITFTGINSVGIMSRECPTITLQQITFQNLEINNLGLIMVNNGNIQSTINLNHIIFTFVKLTSTSLIQTCYAVYMQLLSQATVTMNDIYMQNITMSATDQSFVTTSTAIYIYGFETSLQLTSSTFYNNTYSLSTSLFVLNVLDFVITGCKFNGLRTPSTQYFGSQSENGGVGQIASQYLTVSNTYFTQIISLNGAIFYLQPFSSNSQYAQYTFTSVNISQIYCYGKAAIYIENSHMNTNILMTQVNFSDVYAKSIGGILFIEEVKSLDVGQLNIGQVDVKNISTLPSYTIQRTIKFQQCSFQNIFAQDGIILTAQYYSIIFMNNQFLLNDIVTTNYFSLAETMTGYLIGAKYCELKIVQFKFDNLIASYQLPTPFSMLYAEKSYILIQDSELMNSQFRNSQLIYVENSYLKVLNFYMYNNTVIGNDSITTKFISPIMIVNSTTFLAGFQVQFLICTLPACLGGGLYLHESKALISNSFFWGNKGNYGGAIHLRIDTNQWLVINQSNFTANYANHNGGAIYALISNISQFNVTNSDFFLNNASDSGGAIFSDTSIENMDMNALADVPHIFYFNNSFTNNTAGKYGGALKVQVYQPYLPTQVFYMNSAGIEGVDISSYPAYLYLCEPLANESVNTFVYYPNETFVEGYEFIDTGSGSGQYQIWNVKSGTYLNQSLNFILKSTRNETMYANKSTTLNIVNTNPLYTLETASGDVIKFDNSFNLTQVYLVGVPNSTIGFTLKTDAIKTLGQYNFYYTSTYEYNLIVQFRLCYIGEVIQQGYNDQIICSQCSVKFYSFSLPSVSDPGQCVNCPTTSSTEIECDGGARTNVSQNYWRYSVFSLDLYECDSRESWCIGGVGQEDQLCGTGYYGPLCQSCNYGAGYARDTRNLCVLCQNATWPYFQIIATSLGVLAYLALSIYFVAQDVVLLCVIPCVNQLLPPNKKIGTNLSQVKDLNSLMKIFLAYFQITSIIKYVTQNLPIWVEDVSDPNLLSFSLECPLLPISKNYSIPMIYLTYLIDVAVPVLCLLLFFLMYALIFRKNKVYRNVYIASTWLVLWLFFLPDFYKKTLYLLNCKRIGNNSYLQADLTQSCYQTTHFFYALFVAVPCMIFFVFYIPIMILYKIYRDLTGNEEKRPLRRYKYYYINGEFKEKYFYWEFVRLAEKLLIQTAIEVFTGQVIYMSECSLIIVLIYGVYSFKAQPYGYKQQNFVNVIASLSAFTTVYIALVIATIQTATNELETPTIVIFQILMAIVNVLFITWILWKIFIVLLPVLFVNIEEIQKQIAGIPYLRKYLLNQRQRSRLQFQRIGQQIIVINIIKKKTKRKLLKSQIRSELAELDISERLGVRRRQRTAAQDALDYILRLDNPEMQDQQDLTGWTKKNSDNEREQEEEFIELPNFSPKMS